MSDSVFMKLVTGNRLSMYLGLTMDNEVPFRYGDKYSYVEIPLRHAINASGEETTKVSRNQKVLIVPACKIACREYKVLVKVNPALEEYATFPSMKLIDVDTTKPEQPVFHAQFQKDMDLADLQWCVRLYLLA